MKKYFLLIALCISSFVAALPIKDHTIDSTALSELASGLGIPADADLIKETQKRWLRKAGQERWEIAELSSEQKNFVLNWATNQNLYAAWKPAVKAYDKALILGATTSRMQLRLNYLKQLWNEGTRFDQIVWLTGDRPLDPRADGLTDRCNNESEAAHILWEESDLPKEMKALPVVFIAVPMKKEGSNVKRPNTEDTIVAWLESAPKACKALFVSDQPFCGYQFLVIQGALPKEFLFDVVGQSADPKSHPSSAAITLDTIARCIYQENLNASSNRK